MGIADLFILGIIAVSAVISLWRGFVREAFSLVTWAAAFIIARLFSPKIDILLSKTIDMPSLRMAVAFLLLFIGVLIVGALISKFIQLLVKATGLSGTDRMLGMVFGALRGVLIITVLIALFRPMIEEDAWWQDSYLAPHFVSLEGWTKETGKQVLQYLWQLEPTTVQELRVEEPLKDVVPSEINDQQSLNDLE